MRKPLIATLVLLAALLVPLVPALAGEPEAAVTGQRPDLACADKATDPPLSLHGSSGGLAPWQSADPDACCRAMFLACQAACCGGVNSFTCHRVDLVCEWSCDCGVCD